MPSNFIQAIKELGIFLGGKIDNLSRNQKIDVNIGDSAERFESAADKLAQVATQMAQAEKGRDMTNVKEEMVFVARQLNEGARVLAQASQQMQGQDNEKLMLAIENLSGAVSSIQINVPETDLSGLKEVAGAVSSLEKVIKEKDSSLVKIFKTGFDDLKKVIEGNDFIVPDTIKIDEDQLRVLGASRFGGGLATQSVATGTPTIANVSMSSSSTEYSYTFPSNTLRWELKLRAQGVLLYYSFETGKLPTSGDASSYVTVAQNFVKSVDSVEWSGKTIYLEAASNTQVAEITVYTV